VAWQLPQQEAVWEAPLANLRGGMGKGSQVGEFREEEYSMGYGKVGRFRLHVVR
jgi:hypothetical protein